MFAEGMSEAELKIKHGEEFYRCLVSMDVRGIQKIWGHVAPHIPKPQKFSEWLFAMHMARTQSARMPLKLRQYSFRWLQERGFGSFLPEQLWPNDKGREQKSCVIVKP